MIHGRRSSDRRRRVLYTTHHADNTPTTAASRRNAQRMREARRPTAAYGIRVQRRLRGRWFSLVPVRQTTLITVSAAIGGLTLLLCFLHYASVAWPSIAYRPEIARPLRMDRPDSFGRLYAFALLAGSAGLSLLTYQLRRYRIDDYQGRYRLWRLILVVLVLASINTQVSLIQWGGALLDAGFGRRVALTGGDWLRLVVSIGGAIVALRLCAEVRRCRWALVSMIVASGLLAIPEAAKWSFVAVESIAMWTLVTSAPLLAFTMLFISLTGYLRMLYREVRQIEDGDSLAERFNQFRLRVLSRADRDDEQDADTNNVEEKSARPSRSQGEPKRGWFRRRGGESAEVKPSRRPKDPPKTQQPTRANPQPQTAHSKPGRSRPGEHEQPGEREQPAKPSSRRRWFGLRRAKADSSDSSQGNNGTERGEKASRRDSTPPKKRSRFSLRLAPESRAAQSDQPAQSEQIDASPQTGDPVEANASEANSKKRGLGRWLRSKKPDVGDDSQGSKDPQGSGQPASPRSSENDHNDIDPDDIDWDSMSKSERRRLRKKLRRQGGQAA